MKFFYVLASILFASANAFALFDTSYEITMTLTSQDGDVKSHVIDGFENYGVKVTAFLDKKYGRDCISFKAELNDFGKLVFKNPGTLWLKVGSHDEGDLSRRQNDYTFVCPDISSKQFTMRLSSHDQAGFQKVRQYKEKARTLPSPHKPTEPQDIELTLQHDEDENIKTMFKINGVAASKSELIKMLLDRDQCNGNTIKCGHFTQQVAESLRCYLTTNSVGSCKTTEGTLLWLDDQNLEFLFRLGLSANYLGIKPLVDMVDLTIKAKLEETKATAITSNEFKLLGVYTQQHGDTTQIVRILKSMKDDDVKFIAYDVIADVLDHLTTAAQVDALSDLVNVIKKAYGDTPEHVNQILGNMQNPFTVAVALKMP